MSFKKNIKVISLETKKNFEIGEVVKLIDGSALAIVGDKYPNQNYYIVDAYPDLMQDSRKLTDIPFTVVQKDITGRGTLSDNNVFITDIIVQSDLGIQFYTSSKLVMKFEDYFKDVLGFNNQNISI